jgi:peptidoglycan L-alanyl-D-glutamate endopeptidase CwlK
MYKLGKRSRTNLDGVHPDLIAVVKLAIKKTECDFAVIEGVRSYKRQVQLYNKGASKTLNSRHLTGHAVDLMAWVDGKGSWDWPHYHKIADAMKAAAEELSVELDWGGDWKSFADGPHFQLDWKAYPAL